MMVICNNADRNNIPLVQRLIEKRMGYELVPGSPAWIREISDLYSFMFDATDQELKDAGGLDYIEQYSAEFTALFIDDY